MTIAIYLQEALPHIDPFVSQDFDKLSNVVLSVCHRKAIPCMPHQNPHSSKGEKHRLRRIRLSQSAKSITQLVGTSQKGGLQDP